MMSINFNLKPCPFCGTSSDIYIEKLWIKAYCSNADCGCTKFASYMFDDDKDEDRKLSEVIEKIVNEWNTRVEN